MSSPRGGAGGKPASPRRRPLASLGRPGGTHSCGLEGVAQRFSASKARCPDSGVSGCRWARVASSPDLWFGGAEAGRWAGRADKAASLGPRRNGVCVGGGPCLGRGTHVSKERPRWAAQATRVGCCAVPASHGHEPHFQGALQGHGSCKWPATPESTEHLGSRVLCSLVLCSLAGVS